VARFLDVLHHVHGIVFEKRRIRDEGDVKPSTVFYDKFGQRLKVQIGLLDLRIVHGVAGAVFDP